MIAVSVLKHTALTIIYAASLLAAAVGGWHVFAYLAPINTGMGIGAAICLFIAWQFVLVFLAMGVVLAGAVIGEAEIVLAVPIGIVSGTLCGLFVAGLVGTCFGAFSGILAGATVGLVRHRIIPHGKKRIDRGFEVLPPNSSRVP